MGSYTGSYRLGRRRNCSKRGSLPGVRRPQPAGGSSLLLELPVHNLEFDREVWSDVYYKGAKVGRKRVDFVIDEVSEIPCKTPCPLCLRGDNERNYASPVSAIKAFSASAVLTGRPT